MNREPRVIWLKPYLDPRKTTDSVAFSDMEWERIWRQRVKANEERRRPTPVAGREETYIPAFLREQAT